MKREREQQEGGRKRTRDIEKQLVQANEMSKVVGQQGEKKQIYRKRK